MIELTVQVDGVEQVVERFTRMTDVIMARLRATLPPLGDDLAAAAAAIAPRKHGTMASTIKAKLYERGGDKIVEVIGPGGKGFYGRFQETGLDTMRKPARRRGITGVRTRLSGGTVLVSARHGLMRRLPGWTEHPFKLPAHPFMRPAAEAMRTRIASSIHDAVVEGAG